MKMNEKQSAAWCRFIRARTALKEILCDEFREGERIRFRYAGEELEGEIACQRVLQPDEWRVMLDSARHGSHYINVAFDQIIERLPS